MELFGCRCSRLLETLGAIGGGKVLDERGEAIALKYARITAVVADAMIGHAVLRTIVGADLLGTITMADLARRSAPRASCCSWSILS